ncbi:hypothetical protein BRD18_02065 [Halobacteriales archaeon SW_7_71_33]|nr:MAG: hypothetical protein BRD18_02065 [Halobacteriales archaeon SW_7_71_33]
MSSDTARADTTGSLHDRVLDHLGSELPDELARQATVEAADPDTGRVVLSFGCGCSGGLAPGERAAVRTRTVGVLFRAGTGEIDPEADHEWTPDWHDPATVSPSVDGEVGEDLTTILERARE